MEKILNLEFNQSGILVDYDLDEIRQGDVGVVVKAKFTGKNNALYVARLNLTRPDGTHIDNVIMNADSLDSEVFTKKLDSAWFFAKDGETTLTVFLVDGSGNELANGQVNFDVQKTDYSNDPTITPDQYLEILSLIATKLNMQDGILITDNIDSLDVHDYSDGQFVFEYDVRQGTRIAVLYQLKALIGPPIRRQFVPIYDLESQWVKRSGDTMTGPLKIAQIKDLADKNIIHSLVWADGAVKEIDIGAPNYTTSIHLIGTAVQFQGERIVPSNNNASDLGLANWKWRNLYLAGLLSDGTNSVTIANIAKKDQNNVFAYIPQTTEGRVYNNDRQLTDRGFVTTSIADMKSIVDAEIAEITGDYYGIEARVATIEGLVPSEASASNKLVDRDTMNSTISGAAAFFRGNFSTKADLTSKAWQSTNPSGAYYVTNNDYAVVNSDESHSGQVWRYKYTITALGGSWNAEYKVNDAPFTSDQIKAINSGITDVLVEQIGTNKEDIELLVENKLDTIEAYQKFQSKIVSVDITVDPGDWDEEEKTFTTENIFGTLGFVNNDDTYLFLGVSRVDDAVMDTFNVDVTDVASPEADETYAYLSCDEVPTESVSLRINLIKKNNIIGSPTGYVSLADLDGETIEYRNGKVRVIGSGVQVDATQVEVTTTHTSVQANIIRIDEEINRVENSGKLYSHFIRIKNDTNYLKDICLTIYSRSNVQLTKVSEISEALKNNGNVLANGYLYRQDEQIYYSVSYAHYSENDVLGIYSFNKNNYYLADYNLFDTDNDTVTDVITEITNEE